MGWLGRWQGGLGVVAIAVCTSRPRRIHVTVDPPGADYEM